MMSQDDRDLLVCPACSGQLSWTPMEARCTDCARSYPISAGIPILLLDPAAASSDELEPLPVPGCRSARPWDRRLAEEFEITRPHGTAAFYRWLLRERLRRSVSGLEQVLPGATVLTVCGGPGMDAEFLARAGARVITADISLNAAYRARERARRYHVPFTSIVADARRLPFRDRTVDLVYVLDGLHHLDRPLTGLAEMARGAAHAVAVNEPAQAALTAAAVRLGLALEHEPGGGRIARLTAETVLAELRARGFQVRHVSRYAMHLPALSLPAGPYLPGAEHAGALCGEHDALASGECSVRAGWEQALCCRGPR